VKKLAAVSTVVLAVAVLALAGRVVLVQVGVLYGATAVARVDGIVAGTFGLGLAAATAALARMKARRQSQSAPPGGKEQKPPAFADRVATLTAIGSVVALLVSVLNLFFPVDQPGQAKPTCAGAHTLRTKYVGITTGPDGNNSRSGPARSFPANGRFARDCSVGFSAYCIGDPIEDMAGTTKQQRWLTSRWLLVAKQPAGWRARLASFLSGEKPDRQFVSDANVAPASSYEDLPLAPAAACSTSYRYPGKAVLQIFDPNNQSLTAVAEHAVNIGFATWTPPGQGFRDENAYRQIYSPNFTADANPGAASADGKKTVAWAYHGSLHDNLRPKRVGGPTAPAKVVVMAIPCISDNLPASLNTAATVTYDIAGGPTPRRQVRSLTGFDALRLARAACQANA